LQNYSANVADPKDNAAGKCEGPPTAARGAEAGVRNSWSTTFQAVQNSDVAMTLDLRYYIVA